MEKIQKGNWQTLHVMSPVVENRVLSDGPRKGPSEILGPHNKDRKGAGSYLELGEWSGGK